MNGRTATHRSLARQLRRLRLAADTVPTEVSAWQQFLQVVSGAYHEADEERYILERSLDMSTKEMRELHDTLSHRARHDTLTGLPNRAALVERLDAVVRDVAEGSWDAAVLFIDLDGFKVVNDTLGHQMGDELLKMTAERICASIRSGDVAARLGGDEFVVLCPRVEHPDIAVAIARRIGEQLQKPYPLEGAMTAAAPAGDGAEGQDGAAQGVSTVSSSIGIALASQAAGADQLIANADLAMYEAKSLGKARFVIFDEAMRSRAEDRLDIEAALWHAVEAEELSIHFQPVVDLAGGHMIGAEALVRWERPGHGVLPPSMFIPVAEQSRLISVIDAWVLGEACRQAVYWPDRTVGVSVNLSTKDLRRDIFLPMVLGELERSGLEPHRLTLELTESALMYDPAGAAAVLRESGALGVRTAIDDFGAGHWSMAHLRRLPMDVLKIDQSITAEVVTDPTSAALAGAIITMGHALGARIVAEGIETAEQAEAMARLGCDAGQGYWLGRPKFGVPSSIPRLPVAGAFPS